MFTLKLLKNPVVCNIKSCQFTALQLDETGILTLLCFCQLYLAQLCAAFMETGRKSIILNELCSYYVKLCSDNKLKKSNRRDILLYSLTPPPM